VLNDILDFSRIEAGHLKLESIAFSLRELVGDVLKSLAPLGHEKGLELAHHVAPRVPDTWLGDPGRLRQILVNLIGNAIKFTERGEIVVRVTRSRRARPETGEIADAITRRDGLALQAAAHTLRGSAGYFAADRTTELAARLEQLGRDNDFNADATRTHQELAEELDRLARTLTAAPGT
jgi:light-regulated signal transduction histidine kinase (bacteriophytochrome)